VSIINIDIYSRFLLKETRAGTLTTSSFWLYIDLIFVPDRGIFMGLKDVFADFFLGGVKRMLPRNGGLNAVGPIFSSKIWREK